MTKIDKLEDICSIVKRGKAHDQELLVVDIITEEAIDEVFSYIPKLLALVIAAKNTYHGAHNREDCAICIALEEFEK